MESRETWAAHFPLHWQNTQANQLIKLKGHPWPIVLEFSVHGSFASLLFGLQQWGNMENNMVEASIQRTGKGMSHDGIPVTT